MISSKRRKKIRRVVAVEVETTSQGDDERYDIEMKEKEKTKQNKKKRKRKRKRRNEQKQEEEGIPSLMTTTSTSKREEINNEEVEEEEDGEEDGEDGDEEEELYDSAPKEFVCPISHQVMEDPVTASDGVSYERLSITRWLLQYSNSPSTGLPLSSLSLFPNFNLKSLLTTWKETQLDILRKEKNQRKKKEGNNKEKVTKFPSFSSSSSSILLLLLSFLPCPSPSSPFPLLPSPF
jgi:hypothetical protein